MRKHCEQESLEIYKGDPQLVDDFSETIIPLGQIIEARKYTRRDICLTGVGLLLTACAGAVAEKPKQTIAATKTVFDWATATAEETKQADHSALEAATPIQKPKVETVTPIPELPYVKPTELVINISPAVLNRFDFPAIDLVAVADDETSLQWLRQVQGLLRWNQKKTPARPDWNWNVLRVLGRKRDSSLQKGLWVTAQDGMGKTVGFFSEVEITRSQNGQTETIQGISLAGQSGRTLLVELTAIANTTGGVVGAVQEDENTGNLMLLRPYFTWQTNGAFLLATKGFDGTGSSGVVRGELTQPIVTQEQGFPPFFLSPASVDPQPQRAFLGRSASKGRLYRFQKNAWTEEALPPGVSYAAAVEMAPPATGGRLERVVVIDEVGKRRMQLERGNWEPYQPLEGIFAKGLDYDRSGRTLADGAFAKAQELGRDWPMTFRFGRDDWETGILGFLGESRPDSTLFAAEVVPYQRHLQDGRTVLTFLIRYRTSKGDWQYLARDQERGKDSAFIVNGELFPFDRFYEKGVHSRAQVFGALTEAGDYLTVPGNFSVRLLKDPSLLQPFEAVIDMPTSNPTFRPLLDDYAPYESREVGIKTVGFSRLVLPPDLFERI